MILPHRYEDNVASMAWKLHAIEQMQLRRQHRVDGVGRPIFDFHIGLAASARLQRVAQRGPGRRGVRESAGPGHEAQGLGTGLCGNQTVSRVQIILRKVVSRR